MQKKRLDIQDWFIFEDTLFGTVLGHPNGPEGKKVFIKSSKILSVNYDTKKVETQNTVYSLGEEQLPFLGLMESLND